LKPYKCEENLCVKCEWNPCFQNSNTGFEWVQLKDGTCAELGRNHISCKSSHEEDFIQFSKFYAYPSCEKKIPPPKFGIDLGGIGVPPSKCPPGIEFSIYIE
jgi:hypothetical protein